MRLVEVYSKPVKTIYRSALISKASFYKFVGVCLTIISPLLIAYQSQGFWLTTNRYIEQPRVLFTKQILLIANTQNDGGYVAWSTYTNFNMILGDNLRIATVSSFESDYNGDGKFDNLNMTIQIPLSTSENIVGFQLVLMFDYLLQRYSTFQMQTMAFIDYQSFSPGAIFTSYSDLNLVQKTPLYHRGSDTRYNQPIINSSSLSVYEYDLNRIFQVYSSRNLTTKLDNSYYTWKTGRGSTEPFTIQLSINYPVTTILYSTGFWELVKWGWVQYLAIYVVIKLLFNVLNNSVFSNQLFPTIIKHPKVKLN